MITEMDNSRCQARVKGINCDFRKTLHLKSDSGKTKVISVVVNRTRVEGCGPGDVIKGPNRRCTDVVLQTLSSGMPIEPSTHGDMVRCEYSLISTADMDTFCACHADPHVAIPI